MAELTTSVVLNGGSIDATVYEDLDNTGSADNQETVVLDDGTNTYTLDTLSGGAGNAYWIKFDLSTPDPENSPSVQSSDLGIGTFSKPTTISATTGYDGYIELNWGSSSGASGYYVYRSDTPGSSVSDYTQIADVTSSTSYSDTGISSGSRYFYRVSAYSDTDESELTDEAVSSAAVSGVTTLPTPTTPSASFNDAVDLSWENTDDSTDGTVTVQRTTDDVESWSDVGSDLAYNTTTYTDTNAETGNTYQYRIFRATDHATITSSAVTIETGFDIYIDGTQVVEITIDGVVVSELTIDNTIV